MLRASQYKIRAMLLLTISTAVLFNLSCSKKSDQQQQYPQQQYPQQQYPQQQTVSGVPCGSDADPQCPFGRCIGGKCGGCAQQEHCKPGATCSQTAIGMTCVPAGMPGM